MTDRRTDGQTDGWTDTPSYRDARTHLKMGKKSQVSASELWTNMMHFGVSARSLVVHHASSSFYTWKRGKNMIWCRLPHHNRTKRIQAQNFCSSLFVSNIHTLNQEIPCYSFLRGFEAWQRFKSRFFSIVCSIIHQKTNSGEMFWLGTPCSCFQMRNRALRCQPDIKLNRTTTYYLYRSHSTQKMERGPDQ